MSCKGAQVVQAPGIVRIIDDFIFKNLKGKLCFLGSSVNPWKSWVTAQLNRP